MANIFPTDYPDKGSADSTDKIWASDTSTNFNITVDEIGNEVFTDRDTDNLSEGSTNLYYTDARVDANSTVVGLGTDKADKTNVLELDNTTSFTPDADYEPATKKYVDDEIDTAIAQIRLTGGDGTDGPLNISSGTTTLTLVDDFIEKNYSSITISGTALLDITGASCALGGVAYIKCSGDFTMSAGTVNMTGQGGVNGGGGSAGNDGGDGFQGRNSFEALNVHHYGLAGTSSGAGLGGTGVCGPVGLSTISSPTGFVNGGGGGGGKGNSSNGGAGGRGGGLLIIEVGGAFNFTGGTIQANGNNGGSSSSGGGGGGGGGGTIIVTYNTLTSNTGTIQANGGNGGTGAGVSISGGGGGAGYSDGGNGSASSSAAGSDGTSNSWGSGGTGGALPNGGGGGGAGLYIVKDVNTL